MADAVVVATQLSTDGMTGPFVYGTSKVTACSILVLHSSITNGKLFIMRGASRFNLGALRMKNRFPSATELCPH